MSNGIFPHFTNIMCNDAQYVNKAFQAITDNYIKFPAGGFSATQLLYGAADGTIAQSANFYYSGSYLYLNRTGSGNLLYMQGNINAIASIRTTGSSAFSEFACTNDIGIELEFRTYGSLASGTTAGITNAGLIGVFADAIGNSMMIGCRGADPLYLITNNAIRISMSSSGDIALPAFTTVGYVSNAATTGILSSRTYAQVLSDIGAAPLTHGVSQYYIGRAATTTSWGNSPMLTDAANTCVSVVGLSTGIKQSLFSTDQMQLSALEGGAYFGRVGIKEQQFSVTDYGVSWVLTAAGGAPTYSWRGVAMSSDGRIQSACAYGDYIYISSDYGVTWTAKATQLNWYNIAMSSDGKIQTAVVYGGYIWISSDYGATWAQKGTSLNWRSIAMSADGKLQTAVVLGGYIWISSDYGATWASVATSINWECNAMSSDGKIQTAVTRDAAIWISADYGATWAVKGSSLGYEGIAMSSDGKIQTAFSYGNAALVSSDYGNTWTAKGSARTWERGCMSSDGRIQAGVAQGSTVYVSTDYGFTWSAKTGSGSGTWYCISMSSDGKIMSICADANHVYTSYASSQAAGNLYGGALVSGLTPAAFQFSSVVNQVSFFIYGTGHTTGLGLFSTDNNGIGVYNSSTDDSVYSFKCVSGATDLKLGSGGSLTFAHYASGRTLMAGSVQMSTFGNGIMTINYGYVNSNAVAAGYVPYMSSAVACEASPIYVSSTQTAIGNGTNLTGYAILTIGTNDSNYLIDIHKTGSSTFNGIGFTNGSLTTAVFNTGANSANTGDGSDTHVIASSNLRFGSFSTVNRMIVESTGGVVVTNTLSIGIATASAPCAFGVSYVYGDNTTAHNVPVAVIQSIAASSYNKGLFIQAGSNSGDYALYCTNNNLDGLLLVKGNGEIYIPQLASGLLTSNAGTLTSNSVSSGAVPFMATTHSCGDSPIFTNGTNMGIGTSTLTTLMNIAASEPEIRIVSTRGGYIAELAVMNAGGDFFIATGTTAQSLGAGTATARVKINQSGEIFLYLPTSAGTTGSLYSSSGTVKVA